MTCGLIIGDRNESQEAAGRLPEGGSLRGSVLSVLG